MRVGMLVMDGNSIVQVNSRMIAMVEKDEAEFDPIPLSEDILLRLGFKCVHKNNTHYTINDPNGFKDSHKISIFPTMNDQWHIAFSDMLGGYKDYIPTTKLSYLRQLQNAFFALTGTELTLNP